MYVFVTTNTVCDLFVLVLFSQINQDPKNALILFETILQTHPNSAAAQYGKVKSLDRLADLNRSNSMLKRAIDGYRQLIESDGNRLNDTIFKEAAERCVERMRFIGEPQKYRRT